MPEYWIYFSYFGISWLTHYSVTGPLPVAWQHVRIQRGGGGVNYIRLKWVKVHKAQSLDNLYDCIMTKWTSTKFVQIMTLGPNKALTRLSHVLDSLIKIIKKNLASSVIRIKKRAISR